MNTNDFVTHLKRAASIAGVSRVSDISLMDNIGLPVVQAFRPKSQNYVVSQGRGESFASARVAAIMESLEFYHAENIDSCDMMTSEEVLKLFGYAMETLPLKAEIIQQRKYSVTEAKDLVSGRNVCVPTGLWDLNFSKKSLQFENPFKNTGKGLAGGKSLTEALNHAILELIELHALSMGRFYRVPIDNSLLAYLKPFVDRFTESNIKLAVYFAASDISLPTFKVIVAQPGCTFGFSGTATHPNKDIALRKAYLEALQSRLTYLTGARDNVAISLSVLKSGGPANDKSSHVANVELTEKISFTDILSANVATSAPAEIQSLIIGSLKLAGYENIFYKQISQIDIDIPFVATCIPELKYL